jgi:hypothetical protein
MTKSNIRLIREMERDTKRATGKGMSMAEKLRINRALDTASRKEREAKRKARKK